MQDRKRRTEDGRQKALLVNWLITDLPFTILRASLVRRSFSEGGSIETPITTHFNYSLISLAPCGFYSANLLCGVSFSKNQRRLDGRRSPSPLSVAPPRLSVLSSLPVTLHYDMISTLRSIYLYTVYCIEE